MTRHEGARAASVWVASALAAALGLLTPALAGSVDITTFHVDAQRTGWNASETTLAWANVNASQFGRQFNLLLDEQVDAAPLVVSSATLAAAGQTGYPNDVAIVATENNTIYEIDSGTGAVIRSRHLGSPVAESNLPGGCNNNSVVVGITSTPVIDPASLAIYVVTYTWEFQAPVYRLHKLKFADLTDIVPSVRYAASAKLSDGSSVAFNAFSQRQRPALLFNKNRIYAGFGSFCDVAGDTSRGWIFASNPATLAPDYSGISDTQTNAEASAAWGGPFFLSALWMSGYGLSADAQGYVYGLTGNSDASNVDNFPESALKLWPNLAAVRSYFTPSNFADLDGGDVDVGSGGLMVIPDQPNGLQLAVGAGKDGRMFLLNRKALGGYVAGGPDVPPNVQIGGCWCGPSYFVGSDGKPRIVSSGGQQVETWFLPATASAAPTLEATSPNLPQTSQDPGFHTFVSSNGAQAGTAIVWAVSRPANGYVWLVAFKADDGALAQLYAAPAGLWVSGNNNSNVFPVAAGGKVYVASYKHLEIFGLKSIAAATAPALAATAATEPAPQGGSRFFGTVGDLQRAGPRLTLTLRDGSHLAVDLSPAAAAHALAPLHDGEAVEVQGALSAEGVLSAQSAIRVKGQASWGPDVR